MADETVLTGTISQESNTFVAVPTTREDFQNAQEHFGEEAIAHYRGTNTASGGAIALAEREGVELVPTVVAKATPGGTVAGDAYEYYAEYIVDAARERAADLDGVLLPLHGAMVSETATDAEGTLAERVRNVVGPDVPIVITLDLHTNVGPKMVEYADALVAFETYPHVDMAETGERGLSILLEAIRGDLSPEMAIERPPVVAPGMNQNTDDEPMATIMARARELEEREGIRKVNVCPGFYRADIPEMGFSVSVVHEAGSDGQSVARDVAELVWDERETFQVERPGPAEGVAEAKALAADADAPVVLADVGDNPGGGATGDETFVLRELLAQEVENAGFALIRDPEAVAACIDAGVGERVTVDVGAKREDSRSEPIEGLDGYVRAITDGEFTNTGPMRTGETVHLGRAVLLGCGPDDSLAVVLTENRIQPLDAELWRHVGVQPERLDVVCVKSSNHYRASYEPLGAAILPVDSAGLNAQSPTSFEYERIDRPRFPLDSMADDAYPDW